MLVFDRENLPRHLRFIIGLGVGTAAVCVYAWVGGRAGSWPAASDGLGLGAGFGAAGLVAFALLYPVLRRSRWLGLGRWEAPLRWCGLLGPAAWRLRWHVWVGLAVLPMTVLHAGLWPRPGMAGLAWWVYVVTLGVVASGVFGLTVQQFVPRALRDGVAAESPAGEVRRLRAELAAQAELLVLTAVGPPAPGWKPGSPERVRDFAARDRRGAGRGPLGLLPDLRPPAGEDLTEAQANDAERVWEVFRAEVQPYLVGRGRGKLAVAERARECFRVWAAGNSAADPPAAHDPASVHPRSGPLFQALRLVCEHRRDLDHQVRLERWLRGWVGVHYGLSAALVVLLGWHVATAARYW